MVRSPLSIRQRLVLSLVGLISVSYGLLIATTEVVIRRDRLHRHERLVMATAEAIGQRLASTRRGDGAVAVSAVLGDFSATRILVWLSRPNADPIFPRSPSVQGFFKDPQLLKAAGVNALGMQKPRSFIHAGETYFTCSMPLPNGQGVLRFLEDVGVSPASRKENVILLLGVWLLLVLTAGLLISQITATALRPLLRLKKVMDELSLRPSGVVGGERVPLETQPLELQAIAASYNRLADRLQQAWTQQQLLMRAISHELLTPITLIGSNARRLSRHAPQLPEHDRALLASVQTNAAQMDRVVRDLLDLSQGESGNLRLQFKTFHPYQVLLEILQDVKSMPWGERVRFEPLSPGAAAIEACVEADSHRLRQCVLNVMENASKYSAPDQPIELSVTSTTAAVQIRVQDHGFGIPPADWELVFQPFYRSREAQGQQSGSGVGLAIVRMLMEQMGGTVAVLHSSQQGTTVQFTLPISAAWS